MDIAVVKDEHASGAWIRIGEGNDKFSQELKKAICSD
jgi:hypothetical protein